MRDLTTSDKNEIHIFDNLGGEKIIIYHRTVTASDRLKHRSLIVNAQVKDSKDMAEAVEIALDHSLEFITGFSEGAFSINNKPISSNPESKNYYEGWKGVLRDKASDILESVNHILFSETSYPVKKNSASLMNSGNGKAPGLKKKKKNI